MSQEISVTMGITKALGKGSYEFLRFDASLTKVVEDVHDQTEWDTVWAEVDKQIEDRLKELGNVKEPS